MTKLKGTKIVEVPYFIDQITDVNKSILIIGECHGGTEGISESILDIGCSDVTTTDILDSLPNSWLKQNTNWKHIKSDFIKFNESKKFDYIISISVFEHFGMFWEGKAYDIDSELEDIVLWNHDIHGINKACKLIKDSNSKLIITLPAGPYMNYAESGYPFLRYYDHKRQSLIKSELEKNGYYISNEKFYFSSDFVNWEEMAPEINDPKYYPYYNIHTPNVIWGLTIQQL
jgi:hypothetical protein